MLNGRPLDLIINKLSQAKDLKLCYLSKNYENSNIGFLSRETRLKNHQFIHKIRELWTFVCPFVIDKNVVTVQKCK
jgi:hypothetical protein